MRSLAWWPCTRLVLSNTLPPPAMQDSTRARISTLSSKEKESIDTYRGQDYCASLQASVRVTLNIQLSAFPNFQPALQLRCPL